MCLSGILLPQTSDLSDAEPQVMAQDIESTTTSTAGPIQGTSQSSHTNAVSPLEDPEQAAPRGEDGESENEASGSSTKKSYAQVVLNGVCKTENSAEELQNKLSNAPKAVPQVKQTVSPPLSKTTPQAPSTPNQKPLSCQSKPTSEASVNAISCKLEPQTSPQSQELVTNQPEEPGPHPECPSDRSIFVCRLPLGITEAKVAEVFSGYGALLSGEEGVRVRTGTSACYAFLTYSKPEGAVAALDNSTEIDGETIVCEEWNPRRKPERRPLRGGAGYNRGRPGRYNTRKQAPQSTPAAPQTPKQHA